MIEAMGDIFLRINCQPVLRKNDGFFIENFNVVCNSIRFTTNKNYDWLCGVMSKIRTVIAIKGMMRRFLDTDENMCGHMSALKKRKNSFDSNSSGHFNYLYV